jgi:hypothetical protein
MMAVETPGLAADPMGSDVAVAAMPRGQHGQHGQRGHRMVKVQEENVQTAGPVLCTGLGTPPQGHLHANRIIPKQLGRWKLNSSTGDHEAQCGCELSSAHLKKLPRHTCPITEPSGPR